MTSRTSELPGERMFETLKSVGYELTDESQVNLGLSAYMVAELVLSAAAGADGVQQSARQGRRRIGRNERCPCGSGKKYKRCCLREDRAAGARRPPGEQGLAAIIPRLNGIDAMSRDLSTLAELLEADPELMKLRFSRGRITRFIASLELDPDEVKFSAEEVGELAHRYFLEVEGGELPVGIDDKLLDAASRVSGADQLRSLAFGLLLSRASSTDKEGPNPLVVMLFRISSKEVAQPHDLVHGFLESFGGVQELTRRIEQGGGGISNELDSVFENLPEEQRRSLEDIVSAEQDRLAKNILNGDFPVYLPLATALPALSRAVHLGETTGGRKRTMEELQTLVLESVDVIEPEDLRLYTELLERWLADHPDEALKRVVAVRQVHALASRGDLYPFDWPLVLAFFKGLHVGEIPGEAELLEAAGENPLNPAFLEDYAAFLEHRGFPSLARRTRGLCPGSSPVPGQGA